MKFAYARAGSVLASLAVGMAAAVQLARAEGPGTSADEPVRATWSAVDESWNARDAERFSRLFSEDVTFTFVERKQSLDGRAAIFDHFSKQFPELAADLRHRTRISAVREIAAGVFTADGNVEILRVPGSGDEAPEVLRTFAIFAVMSAADEDLDIRALRIYALPASG